MSTNTTTDQHGLRALGFFAAWGESFDAMCGVLTFDADKITHWHEYFDARGFLAQTRLNR